MRPLTRSWWRRRHRGFPSRFGSSSERAAASSFRSASREKHSGWCAPQKRRENRRSKTSATFFLFRCAARLRSRPVSAGSRLAAGSAREPIDDFSGLHQVELLARDFLQIIVIGTQALDAPAERFVFFLQPIVLLIEAGFLAAQAPQMKRATLADDGHERERQD